ncbi:hypothetical protein [Streptomyces sp. NPDC058252]|uniref:hypothetical protein n=1 Tax=Streptomyces sp. NPDC058252 TaxID=3346405 RepID=UPI0036E6CDF8
MTDTEAQRIRELVAKAHSGWAGYAPGSQTDVSMRALLWEIDHPAPEDQTPEKYAAWLDKVEPRWPDDGKFCHPVHVADLKRRCEDTHGKRP